MTYSPFFFEFHSRHFGSFTSPLNSSLTEGDQLSETVPTINDVLAAIEADDALSLQRRRDICSGVRRLCQALNLQVESTPAAPEFFRDRLRHLTPAAARMSKTRLQNCKSYLDAALNHAHRLSLRRRRRGGCMTPAYRRLLAAVQEPWHAKKLTRFFNFASEQGIEPQEVCEGTFDAYRAALEKSLVKDFRAVDREARTLWNRYAGAVADWPPTSVSVPCYAIRYTLPREQFPQSLWEDLDAYLESRRKKPAAEGIAALLAQLAENSSVSAAEAKPIRDSTAKLIAYRVHQFASALVVQGIAEASALRTLADLVTPARVGKGLMFFVDRARKDRNSQIFGIATDLRMIGKLWVRLDEKDLDALGIVCERTRPRHDGLPESARRSLAPFKSPENVRAFLAMPDRIFARIEKIKNPARADANTVATALWIKIAQRAPLRMANIIGIHLEKNLLRSHGGNSAAVSLFFTSDETKNGKTIEIPLPPATVKLINLYLDKYRKLITNQPNPWLFPATDGKRKNPNTMAEAIKTLMRREIGFAINPHSFRHVAAKLYLSANPGRHVDVQILLQHQKLETTLTYYCDLEAEEAFRHFDATLLGLEQVSANIGGHHA